jgi:hypothetical protein
MNLLLKEINSPNVMSSTSKYETMTLRELDAGLLEQCKTKTAGRKKIDNLVSQHFYLH